MRRLDKRGMDDKLAFTIWEIMVILMVVIALTVSVRGIANNTTYWKKYHSTDLAMMTDLIIASQGNFVINYDMKEMKQNAATKMLKINQLMFQTFLNANSFFVYDESVEKDRFPQSYIFAEDRDIKITISSLTSDYIVLYKESDNIGMKSEYIAPVSGCPAIDTSGSLEGKKISVIGLSTAVKTYSDYINIALRTISRGTDNELLIVLANDNTNPTTIYYNPINDIKSEKISCLTKRALEEIYPDISIAQEPYDTSFEIEPFIGQRDGYMYWMLIRINTADINMEGLEEGISQAITEYYE
jgi:hypothetical protein